MWSREVETRHVGGKTSLEGFGSMDQALLRVAEPQFFPYQTPFSYGGTPCMETPKKLLYCFPILDSPGFKIARSLVAMRETATKRPGICERAEFRGSWAVQGLVRISNCGKPMAETAEGPRSEPGRMVFGSFFLSDQFGGFRWKRSSSAGETWILFFFFPH